MEETPKKKMSKGCMVGLIIGGVVIVLLIAVAIIGFAYRDNIAKFGVVTIVNQVKGQMSVEPVEGVDTVRFNALVDGFLERFAEDEVNSEGIRDILPAMQAASNSDYTQEEIRHFEEALLSYYPELADIYQSMQLLPDSSVAFPEDSAASSE